jgi:hypothetical protein
MTPPPASSHRDGLSEVQEEILAAERAVGEVT